MDEAKFMKLAEEEGDIELLNTIQVPKDLKFLSYSLPQPNYKKPNFKHLDRKSYF